MRYTAVYDRTVFYDPTSKYCVLEVRCTDPDIPQEARRGKCPDGVYADCPFCGDRRGKLKLNYEKNVWRCNYCGKSGGMLALYALAKGVSTSGANRELCDRLLNEGMTASAPLKTAGKEPEAALAESLTLHKTYACLLDNLTLTEKHREHLHTARGLDDAQIAALGYKSVPPPSRCRSLAKKLLEQGCTLEGIPGFYQKDGAWTARFPAVFAGILLLIRGLDGLYKGFQIRLNTPTAEKTKYVWLSSVCKPKGVSPGSPVHIAGNPAVRTVYLTEGILKADIASCLMRRTFLGIAGINNTAQLEKALPVLASKGVKEIILAPDMDRYRNAHVSRGVTQIYTLVRRAGMDCRLLIWNPNYKGVDDWQIALRRPPEAEASPAEPAGRQSYRIYQLEVSLERTIPFAFGGIALLQSAGFIQPPAQEYRLVHDGSLICGQGEDVFVRLARIAKLYGSALPPGYRGRHVAASDVIELYDETDRKYFYREENGFVLVGFTPAMAK